jgi:hypothetical protein
MYSQSKCLFRLISLTTYKAEAFLKNGSSLKYFYIIFIYLVCIWNRVFLYFDFIDRLNADLRQKIFIAEKMHISTQNIANIIFIENNLLHPDVLGADYIIKFVLLEVRHYHT